MGERESENEQIKNAILGPSWALEYYEMQIQSYPLTTMEKGTNEIN
jgi:hypothetical protein